MEVARLQALTFFLVTKLAVSWASVNLGKGSKVKTINTTALEPFAEIQCFTGILRNIQHSAYSKWNGTWRRSVRPLVSRLACCLYGEAVFAVPGFASFHWNQRGDFRPCF